MRLDTKITFVTAGDRVYNEETGNYEQTEDTTLDAYANVTDTGMERMNILYSGIHRSAKTIRVNDVIDGAFDHILIDGKKYKSDNRRIYRHKTVIEVSGV